MIGKYMLHCCTKINKKLKNVMWKFIYLKVLREFIIRYVYLKEMIGKFMIHLCLL